ncbi:MAG: hypothetical protein LBJ64_05430 [Deltaproteobacteria bacterium]|jgi:hypothetical protein|nr:hypothetical protein [Deltaproteobacteria bacterium]
MDVKHTYLFQPGLWTVDGRYLDREENPHTQTGELVIVHARDLWTIDSQLNISGQDPRKLESRYEVTPFANDKSYTDWKSDTDGPEPVYGLFVVVQDAIMMPWQSRSGIYWGQEVLAKVSDHEYISRGFAFIKDDKVASWAARLSRIDSGEASSLTVN